MRRLIGAVAVLGVLWSGGWLVAARLAGEGVRGWLAAQERAGWTAAGAVRVAGFPGRLALTLEALDLYDPFTGFGWQAPSFVVTARSASPTRFAAAFPPEQAFDIPGGRVVVKARDLRAHLALALRPSLRLERLGIDAEGLVADAGEGWAWGAGSLRVALSRAPDAGMANAQRLEVTLADGRVPAAFARALDPSGGLPDTLPAAHLTATIGLDAPLDRHALSAGPPRLTAIEVQGAQIAWGDLEASLEGRVTIDTFGLPTGAAQVRIAHWPRVLALLANAGVITPEKRLLFTAALTAITQGTAEPETLSAPLTFADGRMALGPLPLGPAPVLAFP